MMKNERLPLLEQLLSDANAILDSGDEDKEVNRKIIMSMCQLYKLDLAERRTNECEDIMIELNYEEINLESLSDVRSYIDFLDGMMVHNSDMYNRILELALSYLE